LLGSRVRLQATTFNSMRPELVVAHTRKWVQDVVVGWNFCPFAKSVFYDERLRYAVATATDTPGLVDEFLKECRLLDANDSIETTLFLVPMGFGKFLHYLDLVDLVEHKLAGEGYEGIYQVASFHPDYVFEGTETEDPANYTNRSPYPILHLLREDALTEAIDSYNGDIRAIPETNIRNARRLGLKRMREMLEESRATSFAPRLTDR